MTGLESVRAHNRTRVVDALRKRGTASRADLARDTGLSRSTVSSLVSDLNDGGFVVELPDEAGHEASGKARSSGRPGVLLALDPSAGAVLGVDFGHSHLRVALADLSSRVLAERRLEVDVDRAAASALDGAVELTRLVLEDSGIARGQLLAAGMGLPGPIDRVTGVVGSSVILPGWAGLRAADELSRRLELSVEVDNDANLGALAEASYGAGRGADDVIYVKMSSGIGAGLILGGRLHRGSTGIAGEMGHVLLDPRGRVCRCGNRGCLETVATGPPLLRLLHETHGDDITVAGMIDAALAGDLGCRRVLGDAGRALGRALADLCNHLNPKVIVVGGDLSRAGECLLLGIRESIGRYALPAAAAAVDVRAAVLGERAEVLGALALVIRATSSVFPTFAPLATEVRA